MQGIVNVFKPQNFTSHDCVAILRGVTGIKKIGHTGTLDPMATGVLPCCIGKATRIIEYLDNDLKEYECTMRMGMTSDTMDIWGNITYTEHVVIPDDDRIIRTLKSFEGNIEQIPPKYSAVRVNGRRLYEYARAGKDVEIRPRKVMIQSIDIQSIVNDEIRFKMKCGKGTYVRSVCHDAGELLGTGAVMTQLCRTANGSFKAEDAVDIREIKDSSAELVRKMIRPFYDSLHFRKIHVDHKEAKALSDGKTIYSAGVFEKNEKLSVYTDGFFVGVCVYNEGSINAHKIFNTEII
jgi:tRNA pseudouridine55 synthase